MMSEHVTSHSPIPLRDRDHLSIYWDNHLRVAYDEAAPYLYPAMVEASLAHVLMLRETGVLPEDRANRLLAGLNMLQARLAAGEQSYAFDGSVEDSYYFLEQQLAAACGMAQADLDVQLARSRNDLDAGVFRMILRRQLLDQADLLALAARRAAKLAETHADALIIGYTHRRPAQPTTIGHVLSGLAEALLSQASEMRDVYDELNVSPLGAAAFAGTDLPIDPERLTGLLGFDRTHRASYEAVAGAEHFMRLAALHGRITATGARWARVMLEWMTFGWIETPGPFTQGSSIMPQKRNPVVLEHMVSMAGAAASDMFAVYSNIAAGWYEDSNNATTDVQKHLWESGDIVLRFLRLWIGLLDAFEVKNLPTQSDIVASGATTTAVAEALAAASWPWRRAHDLVGGLVRARPPADWDERYIAEAIAACGEEPSPELVALILAAGQEPAKILDRRQAGGPGRKAVAAAAAVTGSEAAALAEVFTSSRRALDSSRTRLLALAAQ